jgi:hypothetical protein
MSNKYSWKLGHARSYPAEALGNILTEIEKRDGDVTPQAVLAEASQPNSPIHNDPCWLGWNKDKAAESYWLSAARQLITSVEILPAETLPPVQGWINIPASRTEKQAYHHVEIVASDDDKKLRFLGQVAREFNSWQNRLNTYFAMGIEPNKELTAALSIVESKLASMLKGDKSKTKEAA